MGDVGGGACGWWWWRALLEGHVYVWAGGCVWAAAGVEEREGLLFSQSQTYLQPSSFLQVLPRCLLNPIKPPPPPPLPLLMLLLAVPLSQVCSSALHPVDAHHPHHDPADGDDEQHQPQWGAGSSAGGPGDGGHRPGSNVDSGGDTGEGGGW